MQPRSEKETPPEALGEREIKLYGGRLTIFPRQLSCANFVTVLRLWRETEVACRGSIVRPPALIAAFVSAGGATLGSAYRPTLGWSGRANQASSSQAGGPQETCSAWVTKQAHTKLARPGKVFG